MGLFDKLVRKTSDGAVESELSQPDAGRAQDELTMSAAAPIRRPDPRAADVHPLVRLAANGHSAARDDVEDRYDPTHPNQSPVCGIDLITFAAVSRRLDGAPAHEHALLLERYGHTTESWSAVNTAWMARLGQMPFLYDTYDAAYRSR